MLETIYVIRHASRIWETNLLPTPSGINRDVCLTTTGLRQAELLATYLASEDESIDSLICSPFYRALQSLAPLALKLGKDMHIEPGLQEWNRPCSFGLHAIPMTASRAADLSFPVSTTYSAITDHAPRIGETISGLCARQEEIIPQLIKHSDEEGSKTSVWMTHCAPAIAIGRTLLRDKDAEIDAPVCSISKYVKKEQGWEQVWNGRIEHLDTEAESHWQFADEPKGKVQPGYVEDDLIDATGALKILPDAEEARRIAKTYEDRDNVWTGKY